MLYIFFMLIMLFPALTGFGVLSTKIFRIKESGLALTMLSGIFFCTTLWTIIAFFCNLNGIVELITLATGILSFFYFRIYLKFWDLILKNKAVFLSSSIVIIFFGSYYPFILDHFGYYVPTIKWLSEVGLVQGISNLDLLLGQMSLWHIFQAGFSNFSDPFLRINVLVLIIYLIYILENKNWIHFLFLPVLFLFLQSPSPDLPVIAFSLIILNEVFNSNKNTVFLFAFSIFIFGIKPTMIWVPVFVFFYSFIILKGNCKCIIFGPLIFILFIFKNIWTFGFPFFPVQIFDLGLSWKSNAELLQNSSQMAMMKTYDMQYPFSEIQKFSNFDYLKNWLFLDGIKSRIHIVFILSLIVFLIFSVVKKSRLIWFLFLSILIKSLLILLFSAQYRFFFDVFFVVIFVLFYHRISRKNSIVIFTALSFIMAGFLSFPTLVKEYIPSFRLGNYMTGFSSAQFFKPSYFELKKYKTHQIGNLQFNVVDEYFFSFDTPLPAISPQFIQEDLEAGIFPQLKGKTLKEGFIWRKISEKEKEKLRNILKDFQ